MNEICAKTFFKGKFMCTLKFCVCAHLMTCAGAHAHERNSRMNIDHEMCCYHSLSLQPIFNLVCAWKQKTCSEERSVIAVFETFVN